MLRTTLSLILTLSVSAVLGAAPPGPEETWPGFRGHPRASGYAVGPRASRPRLPRARHRLQGRARRGCEGREIYKVPIGGHTFSASPVAAGDRILLLTEDGMTFVIAAGDGYREIARNDLAEMSLASSAIAGGAVYVRTETKLYKIQSAR